MRNVVPAIEGFGETLELLRKQKGLTQEELAKEVGISQRMISHYENKVKSPPLKIIILIAKALNVSLDILLSNEKISRNFDSKITKKIKIIENLSLRDQNAIWSFVNALIAKRELKQIKIK